MNHVLGERPAESHGDGALDLAAALHGVDQAADVRRMDAMEDPNLRRHAVHGETHPVNVEGNGTGRKIGLTLCFETMTGLRAGRIKIAERYPALAADNGTIFYLTGRAINAGI